MGEMPRVGKEEGSWKKGGRRKSTNGGTQTNLLRLQKLNSSREKTNTFNHSQDRRKEQLILIKTLEIHTCRRWGHGGPSHVQRGKRSTWGIPTRWKTEDMADGSEELVQNYPHLLLAEEDFLYSSEEMWKRGEGEVGISHGLQSFSKRNPIKNKREPVCGKGGLFTTI